MVTSAGLSLWSRVAMGSGKHACTSSFARSCTRLTPAQDGGNAPGGAGCGGGDGGVACQPFHWGGDHDCLHLCGAFLAWQGLC